MRRIIHERARASCQMSIVQLRDARALCVAGAGARECQLGFDLEKRFSLFSPANGILMRARSHASNDKNIWESVKSRQSDFIRRL
jgi:hypothetical protein